MEKEEKNKISGFLRKKSLNKVTYILQGFPLNKIQSWELFCWILNIPIHRSQYSLWAFFIWGFIKTTSFRIFILAIHPLIKAPFNPWLGTINIYARYRMKIKLICRLTKDQDQALIPNGSQNQIDLKGTVSVISSDPPTRFTTVPLKALSDQAWIK